MDVVSLRVVRSLPVHPLLIHPRIHPSDRLPTPHLKPPYIDSFCTLHSTGLINCIGHTHVKSENNNYALNNFFLL